MVRMGMHSMWPYVCGHIVAHVIDFSDRGMYYMVLPVVQSIFRSAIDFSDCRA